MPYNITALFFVRDEFCKTYEEWEKHRLINTGKKRHPGSFSSHQESL